MKILVTGSEGYIGSVLVPFLQKQGYKVCGLDIGLYSDRSLIPYNPKHTIIKKDIREVEKEDFSGFDAVIHLAGLSNDPLGNFDEAFTYSINYDGTVRVAECAKKAGVKKFLFASSCSLYGYSGLEYLTENDQMSPQTPYAYSKLYAEQALLKLADTDFCPVFLRKGTVYGIAPFMRFDLVVNNLCGSMLTKGNIAILGDGMPWRPLVAIEDVARAYLTLLVAKKGEVLGQAFNIGNTVENYQIKTIAEIISAKNNDAHVTIAQKNSGDTRDYKVSFEKIEKQLGYKTLITLPDGVEMICKTLKAINFTEELFADRRFTRLNQLNYIVSNNLQSNYFIHHNL